MGVDGASPDEGANLQEERIDIRLMVGGKGCQLC